MPGRQGGQLAEEDADCSALKPSNETCFCGTSRISDRHTVQVLKVLGCGGQGESASHQDMGCPYM